MSQSSSAKDILFNKDSLTFLCTALKSAYPAFNQSIFLSQIFDNSWKDKSLKDSKNHVSTVLNNVINKPYEQAIDIILQANRKLPYNYFMMIFPDFVETHGIDHLDVSMQALKELTTGSTSEFAVRPFIHRYQADAMAYMYAWSKDNNEHIRRLSCEGCRPRLPWSTYLTEFVRSPQAILPILEQLKYDDSQYVKRSVGNCMNDISKNHPEIVLDLCRKWKNQEYQKVFLENIEKSQQQDNKSQQYNKNSIDAIATRACRTLLKKGNQQALELFGVGDQESVQIKNLLVKDMNVEIGGELQFEFDLVEISEVDKEEEQLVKKKRKSKKIVLLEDKEDNSNHSDIQEIKEIVNSQQNSEDTKNTEILVRVEYKIGYLKSNKKHSSKIFMLKKNFKLKQGTSIRLKGTHKMQQNINNKLYPGNHYIEITVNGINKAKQEFMLI